MGSWLNWFKFKFVKIQMCQNTNRRFSKSCSGSVLSGPIGHAETLKRRYGSYFHYLIFKGKTRTGQDGTFWRSKDDTEPIFHWDLFALGVQFLPVGYPLWHQHWVLPPPPLTPRNFNVISRKVESLLRDLNLPEVP